MRKILLTFIVSIFLGSLMAQEGVYKRISVNLNENSLLSLAESGIPVDEGYLKNKHTYITELSSLSLSKLEANGISYEVLIDDMASFYVERAKDVSENDIRAAAEMAEVPIPDGFNLGSMGGFLTYDEMLAELDSMLMEYPGLISERAPMHADLTTIEGRPIYYVRLSDNPNTNEDEPELLYTGMHHAREPGGMMALIFYMYHLLENYDSDPEIKQIVDNNELYFAPCVNPDGYLYNQETNPNGGGMWRKNRRENEGGSYGVDINRNYGYQWGLDNTGSSGNPWDETYRGEAPFSEPETQILKEFCEAHEFGIAINFHSYSNLLLYTWGWTEDPCEDDELLYAYSEQMTQVNNYTFGPGSTTIYPTNGGSDDWMYGEQETKNKILAFTPEIGSSSDGFWPSPDRIIPHCQENLLMNILAAKFAGAYAALYDQEESIIAEAEGYLNFDIKRLGLADGATYAVNIEPLTDNFASIGESIVFEEMELMETRSDSISYSFANTILPGDSVQYVLAVDNGSSVSRDTLSKVYGTPTVIYENQIDQLEGFENDDWGFTAEDFTSQPYSITDSPNANYGNNEYSTITITDTVDLTNAVFAQLSFEAKWDIESGYDYVQVQISNDFGANFTPLSGMHTVAGTSYQQEGEPVYDGIQNQWITENISLTEFLGEQILFRFVFESDVGVTEDGFYFDDLMVNVLQQSGTSIQYQMDGRVMVKVFPNPAHEYVTFDIAGDVKYDHIILTNAQGKTVKSWEMSQSREVYAIEQLPAGYYFYSIRSENSGLQLRGKLIIR